MVVGVSGHCGVRAPRPVVGEQRPGIEDVTTQHQLMVVCSVMAKTLGRTRVTMMNVSCSKVSFLS